MEEEHDDGPQRALYFLRGSEGDLQILLYRLISIYGYMEGCIACATDTPINTPSHTTALFRTTRYIVRLRRFDVWFICLALDVLDA